MFLAIFFLTTLFCYSQKKHLEPVKDFKKYEGVLKEYYDNVFPLLNKGYQERPYARYTSMPSFSCEYSFSVEKKDYKYFIISNTLSENYWYAKNRSSVELISVETEIKADLYEKVGELFQLLAVQTEKPEIESIGSDGTTYYITTGCDGTTYYFTTTNKSGEIEMGEIWSPNENSLLGRLINICDNLYSIGNGKDISQKDVLNEIVRLIEELRK